MPARSTACLMAWPARAAPWVWLKPPRADLARPVRAVETITASRILFSLPQVLERTHLLGSQWNLVPALAPDRLQRQHRGPGRAPIAAMFRSDRRAKPPERRES